MTFLVELPFCSAASAPRPAELFLVLRISFLVGALLIGAAARPSGDRDSNHGLHPRPHQAISTERCSRSVAGIYLATFVAWAFTSDALSRRR